MAATEDVTPTVAGIDRLIELGSRAIGQRIALRLARLSPSATALAGAVAILGEQANPAHAAALAGLSPSQALQTAQELAATEILRPGTPLGFVHPLVRAAVYEHLPQPSASLATPKPPSCCPTQAQPPNRSQHTCC